MKSCLTILVLNCMIYGYAAAQGWIPQTSPLGTETLGKVQFVSLTEGWATAGNVGKLIHTTNAGTDWLIVTPGLNDTVRFVNNPGYVLSFINANTGWVIGMGTSANPGTVIYKTTNGGVSWNKSFLNPWVYGWSVQFLDANNGWATIASGIFPNITSVLIHSTDGGNNWTPLYGNLANKFAVSQFVDLNNGWMFVDSISSSGTTFVPPSQILHTTNGGANWTLQLYDNTPGFFRGFHFTDSNSGWVVGDSAKIYKTTNSGTTWSLVTNAGIQPSSYNDAPYFLNTNMGWIANQPSGTYPMVLHTTDGGASWSHQTTTSNSNITSIFFVDTENGWFTGSFGNIFHTTSGGEPTSVSEDYSPTIPGGFVLKQNYPNPFNPTTTIKYQIPKFSFVNLKVYDVLGNEIAILVNEEKAVGTYELTWYAENLPSGVYFYQLKAGNFTLAKKLILMK